MAHGGQKRRLGLVGLLGQLLGLLVVGDIVEDQHGAGKLIAHVEHGLRLDLEAAQSPRSHQHLLATLFGQGGQGPFEQRQGIAAVVTGTRHRRAAKQRAGGLVGVVDLADTVEQDDRVLEALKNGQVLVFLMRQAGVYFLRVEQERAFVLRRPFAAKADFQQVKKTVHKFAVTRQPGWGQFTLRDQVHIGLAVVLHQPHKAPQGNAA